MTRDEKSGLIDVGYFPPTSIGYFPPTSIKPDKP